MELLPGELMSRDNVDSMRIDNICSGCALPFGLAADRARVRCAVVHRAQGAAIGLQLDARKGASLNGTTGRENDASAATYW